jgi:hypothetical protein
MNTNSPTTQTLNQLRDAQRAGNQPLPEVMEQLLEQSLLSAPQKSELRQLHTRLIELKRNRLAGLVTTEFEAREATEVKSAFLSWLGETINLYGKLAEEAALTWPELKEKLLAILVHNGVLPALDLLKLLVWDKVCKETIASLERDYDDYVWSINDTLTVNDNWKSDYAALNRRTRQLIQDFDPAGLKAGWEGLYREATEDFSFRGEGEVFALISRTAEVQVPTQIVSVEEQQRYKRLIYHYQDAYAVGDFQLAYDTLLKARYELEVESPQLYEYLLLSYFNLIGERAIIHQIVDGRKLGEPDHLRYLLLYAGRSRYFQRSEKGVDHNPDQAHRLTDALRSDSVEYNVRQITRGLLLRLCEAMAELRYDYLAEGPLEENHPLYRRLTNCLRTSARINHFVAGDVLFAEQLILELSGGHRNQWIGIDDGKLVDNYPNFPARKLLRQARRLYAFTGSQPEDAEHRIAEDVAIQLADKYQNLVLRGQLGIVEDRLAHARSMTLCLNTFRVVAALFTADRLFYDIPIRELLEGESELNWYRFTKSGQLVQREALLSVHEFNVLDHLQYLVTEKYGVDAWSSLYGDLRKRQYEVLREETEEVLDRINSRDYRVVDATATNVERAITYLENCETLYHVYGDVQHLENALQEILGNKNFHWFLIGHRGLLPARPPGKITFDASLFLDRILRERPEISRAECDGMIANNYFRLHTERRFREMLERKKKYGRLEFEQIAELSELLAGAATIYAHVRPDPRYRDFVLNEFTEERLLRYLDIHEAELIPHLDAEEAELDVLGILDTFREMGHRTPADDRLDPNFLLRATVYNRKEDMDRYYRKEFHRLQRHNYLDEDRLRMIDLVDRYFQFSQIVNDRALLEIPYREYVLNHGRIRWGWSLVPSLGYKRPVGFFQHWRNANIPEFSFRLRRSMVKNAYAQAPVVERLMPKRLEDGSQEARLREDYANA